MAAQRDLARRKPPLKTPSHAFKHDVVDDELEDEDSEFSAVAAGDAQKATARKKSFARWSWSVSLILIGVSVAIIAYTGFLVWSID